MPVCRALQIVGGNIIHQISAVWLSRAFTDLGFMSKRTSSSRGFIVVQRSAESLRDAERPTPEPEEEEEP